MLFTFAQICGMECAWAREGNVCLPGSARPQVQIPGPSVRKFFCPINIFSERHRYSNNYIYIFKLNQKVLSSGPTSVWQRSWVCGWSCVQDLISALNGIWAAYRGNTLLKFFFGVVPKHINSHSAPLWCFFQLAVTRWRYAPADNLSWICGGCQPLFWQAHLSDQATNGEFTSNYQVLEGLYTSEWRETSPLLLSVCGGRPDHRRAGGEWIWIFCQRQQLHAVYKRCEFPTGNHVVLSNLQGFIQSIQQLTAFAYILVSPNKRHQGAPADFRQLGGLEIRRDGGR